MRLIDLFKPKNKKTTQKVEVIEGIEFKFRKVAFSKSLRITIKGKNKALVTLPRVVSFKCAREFALLNLDEIKFQSSRFKSVDEAQIETLRKRAQNYLPKRLSELAQKYGYKYKKVALKRMKTRWGSCSYRNNINLNISLMQLDSDLIDYVLLHELVHTVEKNHQSAFWARLLADMPDAKSRQKVLKTKRVV